MSLLGDIARIVAQGTGQGMVQNSQWGYEKDKIAAAEAADNTRLDKQLGKYKEQIESNEKIHRESNAAISAENQKERADRAEQARLDRESNLRIAGMRGSGNGSSKRSALDALQMLDTTIKDIDKQRGILLGDLQEAQTEPEKTRIQAQIDTLTTNRSNLISSPETKFIVESNGQIGTTYISQYFEPKPDQLQAKQDVPESIIRAPQRPTPSGAGLLTKMSNNQQSATEQPPASQAFTHPSLYQGTAQSMHRGGGTTAEDADNALAKIGYHIPTTY